MLQFQKGAGWETVIFLNDIIIRFYMFGDTASKSQWSIKGDNDGFKMFSITGILDFLLIY